VPRRVVGRPLSGWCPSPDGAPHSGQPANRRKSSALAERRHWKSSESRHVSPGGCRPSQPGPPPAGRRRSPSAATPSAAKAISGFRSSTPIRAILVQRKKAAATRQIHQHRERRGDRGSQASTQAPPDPGQSSAEGGTRPFVGLPQTGQARTADLGHGADGQRDRKGQKAWTFAAIHGMFCSPAAWKRIDATAGRRDRGPVSRPGMPRGILPSGTRLDLFGSRARRSLHEDSDYDILLTIPDDGGPVDVYFAMDAAQAAAMRADPAAEVNLQILSETAVEDAYFDTDFMRTAQRDMVDVGHLLEGGVRLARPSGRRKHQAAPSSGSAIRSSKLKESCIPANPASRS